MSPHARQVFRIARRRETTRPSFASMMWPSALITRCWKAFRFELPRGETKILMGVSGTGKTLALKLALGLLKPDAGALRFSMTKSSSMREQELFSSSPRNSAWCFRRARCSTH